MQSFAKAVAVENAIALFVAHGIFFPNKVRKNSVSSDLAGDVSIW